MARRKNTKFIDPRYFMDEKTEQSPPPELTEGFFSKMFGGGDEEEEEDLMGGPMASFRKEQGLGPGGMPYLKLTPGGEEYITRLRLSDNKNDNHKAMGLMLKLNHPEIIKFQEKHGEFNDAQRRKLLSFATDALPQYVQYM